MQKVAGAEVVPEQKDIEHQEHGRLFHVVLLDDDEHTYDYVIEMLQKLFFLSAEAALQHAVEVDTAGRTIVITCERSAAEFARDQIHAEANAKHMERLSEQQMTLLEENTRLTEEIHRLSTDIHANEDRFGRNLVHTFSEFRHGPGNRNHQD